MSGIRGSATFAVLIASAICIVILYVLSYFPLPYYTKVLPAKPGCPRGWVRPFEISLYQGSLWIHCYVYSGIGRAPQNGFRRYQFVGESQPSRHAWEQNFDDIRCDWWLGGTSSWRIPLLVPLALLVGVYFIPRSVRGVRRRIRRDAGRCEHCGYDLTGNVSGRCPECGAVF